MKSHGNRLQGPLGTPTGPISGRTLARPPHRSPSGVGGLVRLRSWLSHSWVKSGLYWLRVLLAFVALLCQIALVLVTWYLIDMGVAMAELWLELARKHLELTL